MVELLELATELRSPQLCDPQFQMLYLSGARVELRLQSYYLFVARQQQCLKGIQIVGEFGSGQHRLSLRDAADVYKADVGRQGGYG